jgi:hypothetical protein
MAGFIDGHGERDIWGQNGGLRGTVSRELRSTLGTTP